MLPEGNEHYTMSTIAVNCYGRKTPIATGPIINVVHCTQDFSRRVEQYERIRKRAIGEVAGASVEERLMLNMDGDLRVSGPLLP